MTKKSFAITSIALIIVVLLLLLATMYFQPSAGSYLFSAAGLSKQELKKGFIATISDGKDGAVPGQKVTYTFTFKHNLSDAAFEKFNPVMGVEVKGLNVSNISHDGNTQNEVVVWDPVEMGYGQTEKRTFQVTVPKTSYGKEYCVNAVVVAMKVLPIAIADAKDCTKIVAKIVPEKTVKTVFQKVFGRGIKPAENTYWNRRAQTDKTTESLLKAAMEYYKARGLTAGK